MKKVIDFHSHIFPDAVAQKAADNVGNYYSLPLSGNGTLSCLLGGEVDEQTRWVVSSAALNPPKTAHINEFIHKTCISNPRLIGLGSIHRDTPDREAEIERIVSLGLKGIKLHPDFQGFDIDDPAMFPVYEQIGDRLPVLFHVGDRKSDHSHPKRLKKVAENFPKLVIVAAHMGGYSVPELAEEYLVGTRVYMDTSNALRYMSGEQLTDMIRRQGVDRILFGSDFPLMLTREAYEQIRPLRLTDAEWDAVLWQNAEQLLKL